MVQNNDYECKRFDYSHISDQKRFAVNEVAYIVIGWCVVMAMVIVNFI